MATQKEAAENFERVARSSETALGDLTKTTQEFRKAKEEEIEKLTEKIAELKKESQAKHDMVAELTNDLMNVRGEQDQLVEDLKNRIESLKKEMESYLKDAESSSAEITKLNNEIKTLRERETQAQVSPLKASLHMIFLLLCWNCQMLANTFFPFSL